MGELNFMLKAQTPDPTRTASSKALTDGLGTFQAQYEAEQQAQKATRAQARGRMERAINKMETLDDVDKIPTAYRPQVNEFLINQKNRYYNAAQALSQYEVGSPEYIAAIDQMNSVNSSFKNLNAQLVSFANSKKEAMKDFDAGLVSNGNSAADVDWLSRMYTDSLPMAIGQDGSMYFQRGDGFVSMSDSPSYFLRDSKAAKAIIDLNAKIYGHGMANNEQAKQMVGMQVRQIVEGGGRETALSLATDDQIYPGGLGIVDQDLLTNPDRTAELQETVINSYTDMIINSGVQGDKDRIARTLSTRASRTGGGNNSQSGNGSYQIANISEQDLEAMTPASIPPLERVVNAINSNNPEAFFEGMDWNGHEIIAAVKVPNTNTVRLGYSLDGNLQQIDIDASDINKVVTFIRENFTDVVGFTRSTTEGRYINHLLSAYLHKSINGSAGGYNVTN